MEKMNVGESNQDTNGDGLWLSKQDSRRNFGGDTPKGSIGSTPIPYGGENKNQKGGNDN